MAMVVVVLAGLLFVTRSRAPRAVPITVYFPPGATVISASVPAYTLRASGSSSNTYMWFAGQFGLGFGGSGASFHYRSSGLTPFSRNILRSGMNRVGIPAIAEATTLMVNRSGRIYIFHITQQSGETNAIIHAMEVTASHGTRGLISPIPPFPRSISSSSSGSGDMNFQTTTAYTNVAGVAEWYSRQLGLPAADGTTVTNPPGKGTVFRLAPPEDRPRKEVYFVQMQERIVSFIHAVEKGSNNVEVVVASAAR
jgi:hypothetical protein